MQAQNALHQQTQNSRRAAAHCAYCPLAGKCNAYITSAAPATQIAVCIYAAAVMHHAAFMCTGTGTGLQCNTAALHKEMERIAPYAIDAIHAGWLCEETDGGNGFCNDAAAIWQTFMPTPPSTAPQDTDLNALPY